MISDTDVVVLDTNVLVHLGRGKEVSKWMEATWKLLSRPRRCIVSRVTHAEIIAFMVNNGWGDKSQLFISKILAGVVTVEITAAGVQNAYVEADVLSRKNPTGAIRMGKNDLWIVATAKAINGTLITCDNDYDHLSPAYCRLEKYDPDTISIAGRNDGLSRN